MDYQPVLFRFIQAGDAAAVNGNSDHLLRIKRNRDNFTWSYSEADRSKAQYIEFADGAATLKALERMLHLLSWDTDPYENIQVVAPGYPMVMLSMDDMSDWWPTLRPFLEGIFDNWPLSTTQTNVIRSDDDLANPVIDAREDEEEDDDDDCDCCEKQDEEDEEDGEITDSDDTDPNMPALMRIEEILRQASQRNAIYNDDWVNQSNSRSTQWQEEGEERQRKEPITIRRIVNTPNGPRTHIRFI